MCAHHTAVLRIHIKLGNVSCDYDRLNGWNSTLPAAWHIIIYFCLFLWVASLLSLVPSGVVCLVVLFFASCRSHLLRGGTTSSHIHPCCFKPGLLLITYQGICYALFCLPSSVSPFRHLTYFSGWYWFCYIFSSIVPYFSLSFVFFSQCSIWVRWWYTATIWLAWLGDYQVINNDG